METKQVIVIRKDLNMRKGKMCAQAAHASMKVILDEMCSYKFDKYTHYHMSVNEKTPMENWLNGTFTKVVVGCDSEEELIDLKNKAIDSEIPCSIIQDIGKTEFHNKPTYTALAIGPGEIEKIDKITGNLKLL